MAKEKKKGGAAGKLAIVAALLVGLYFLKDCLPGFGLGGGASDGLGEGDPATSASVEPEATSSATASASAEAAAPQRVVVKGTRCWSPDETGCDEACEALAEVDAPIIIDASEGSQGTVEELEACLAKAEKSVSIESE